MSHHIQRDEQTLTGSSLHVSRPSLVCRVWLWLKGKSIEVKAVLALRRLVAIENRSKFII